MGVGHPGGVEQIETGSRVLRESRAHPTELRRTRRVRRNLRAVVANVPR